MSWDLNSQEMDYLELRDDKSSYFYYLLCSVWLLDTHTNIFPFTSLTNI